MTARTQRNASGRRCVFAAVSLGGALLAWTSCVTPTNPVTTVTAPPRPAVLAINNPTPYAWRIDARPNQGSGGRRVSVAGRSTAELALESGEYTIEQRIATPGVASAETRTFAMTFEPGERYAWELATLLTASDEAKTRTP